MTIILRNGKEIYINSKQVFKVVLEGEDVVKNNDNSIPILGGDIYGNDKNSKRHNS